MIDWQLQVTFDNFLRFSIYRLSYSTLFMSTTVCSSACRRYEPLIIAVTLPYILLYYMFWLIYCCSHLLILVSFYSSLLCLYAFCIFPLQVLQQFILPLDVHLIAVFSEILQQHFWHFLQQFLIRQCYLFQYYLLYICIIPRWFISACGCYMYIHR